MAKYTIKFSCGHTEERQLFGKHSDRERKIQYFEESGLCTECWKAEQGLQQKRENAEAAEENAKKGMAKLEGSEKQVAWAESIRRKYFHGIELMPDGYTPNTEKEKAGMEWAKAHWKERVEETSAKWWIDHRNGPSFYEEALKKQKELEL